MKTPNLRGSYAPQAQQAAKGAESESLVGILLWIEDLPEPVKRRILDNYSSAPMHLVAQPERQEEH